MSGPSREQSSKALTVAPKFFPPWFDLCFEADQLGPIPIDWLMGLEGGYIISEVEKLCH